MVGLIRPRRTGHPGNLSPSCGGDYSEGKARASPWLPISSDLAGLWKEGGLVFTTRVGTPVGRQELVTRSFKPLLRKAGLPDIRFHDLRHTCATLLLSKGVHAKFVQELLGHATISITMDTYSHVLPGMGDATAGAMDETLG